MSVTYTTQNISTRLFDRITCLSAYKTRWSNPPLLDANHSEPHEPVVHSEFVKPPQIYHIISHRVVPPPVTRALLSLNPSLEIIPIEVHTKPVQPSRVFGFFGLHLFSVRENNTIVALIWVVYDVSNRYVLVVVWYRYSSDMIHIKDDSPSTHTEIFSLNRWI